MSKSHDNGKDHVLEVYNELLSDLSQHPTAVFIKGKYSNIDKIFNKYQHEQPDTQPDLTLNLANGESIAINLFSINGTGKIQPKNLGAKSFIGKYFYNDRLQQLFNEELNIELRTFYKELLKNKNKEVIYDTISNLRAEVKQLYPEFNVSINPIRTAFLTRIRDIAFRILKDLYNANKGSIEGTFRQLMMTDSVNIISRKDKSGIYKVEEWKLEIDYCQPIELYKKSVNAIGLRIGQNALTLRFKFESRPASSIKLATSYDVFPVEEAIQAANIQSAVAFENELSQHSFIGKKSDSNAIGKCNEAIVYYRMLKNHPKLEQVNEEAYIEMLKKYSPIVKEDVIAQLNDSSEITVKKINGYLNNKYANYTLKSIELVPDSYIKDRLDTSDLKLILIENERYVEEGLSLKAISKRDAKITVKNPGAGQILGPQYFGVGSLKPLIERLKEQFLKDELDHRACLEAVAKELGDQLKIAPKEKIQKGLNALLGESPRVITIYGVNDCVIIEVQKVANTVEVKVQYPSKIQTTFEDKANDFELSLRAKFSSGQDKGWSSVKFAGEMQIK